MTVSNATKIMGRAGEVLEVEDSMVNGMLMRSFIRVRVLINTQNPLSRGCWVPRKNPRTWIMFLYEKLQGLCYNCEIIEHEQKAFKKPTIMIAISNEIPRYGAKLSIPLAKPLHLIIRGQER